MQRPSQDGSELPGIGKILDVIYEKYGHDFRSYSLSYLTRRIQRKMVLDRIADLDGVKTRILNDQAFLDSLVADFSICVTEMFRDPDFFRALRTDVLPYLETQPFIKVWIAGCASGEEAYSIAILLHEHGLLERSLIYATDINDSALQTAQHGIFTIDHIRKYTDNYQKSGGTRPFVDYYRAYLGFAELNRDLKKNILFSHHNLVADQSFGEMHLILCRNVLIYFDRKLQDRVFSLFLSSLAPRGFLGLGSKESLLLSSSRAEFEAWVSTERIYRKIVP